MLPAPVQLTEFGVTVADSITPSSWPGGVIGTLATAGTTPGPGFGPVSCTKLTVAPGTNPEPLTCIVIGWPPLSAVLGAEVTEIELTEGTSGFHCQLCCVMLSHRSSHWVEWCTEPGDQRG